MFEGKWEERIHVYLKSKRNRIFGTHKEERGLGESDIQHNIKINMDREKQRVSFFTGLYK